MASYNLLTVLEPNASRAEWWRADKPEHEAVDKPFCRPSPVVCLSHLSYRPPHPLPLPLFLLPLSRSKVMVAANTNKRAPSGARRGRQACTLHAPPTGVPAAACPPRCIPTPRPSGRVAVAGREVAGSIPGPGRRSGGKQPRKGSAG